MLSDLTESLSGMYQNLFVSDGIRGKWVLKKLFVKKIS